MKKIDIIKTHIEYDIVNNNPTLVYTDESDQEWVIDQLPASPHDGFISKLVTKEESWYFKPENKKS